MEEQQHQQNIPKVIYCYDKKMKFLCDLFPTVDKGTIEAVWKKNGYNMNKTTDELQETNSPHFSPSESPLPQIGNEECTQDETRKSVDSEENRVVPETVILDCKMKHGNSLEITYFIPKDKVTENMFVAVYDRFETDINQYVNCAYCHGKASAFVHFDHMKEGKYTVKLFLNHNEKEVAFQNILIGEEMKIDYLMATAGKKRKIVISVENNERSYWIGIYNQSIECHNNQSYLLSSSVTKEKSLTLDISQLKPGNYQCRIFTKESTDGFLFRKYHSLGECSFSFV